MIERPHPQSSLLASIILSLSYHTSLTFASASSQWPNRTFIYHLHCPLHSTNSIFHFTSSQRSAYLSTHTPHNLISSTSFALTTLQPTTPPRVSYSTRLYLKALTPLAYLAHLGLQYNPSHSHGIQLQLPSTTAQHTRLCESFLP